MIVNIITPIENPTNLDGHKLPSKNVTICLTDIRYKNESGNPNIAITIGF